MAQWSERFRGGIQQWRAGGSRKDMKPISITSRQRERFPFTLKGHPVHCYSSYLDIHQENEMGLSIHFLPFIFIQEMIISQENQF